MFWDCLCIYWDWLTDWLNESMNESEMWREKISGTTSRGPLIYWRYLAIEFLIPGRSEATPKPAYLKWLALLLCLTVMSVRVPHPLTRSVSSDYWCSTPGYNHAHNTFYKQSFSVMHLCSFILCLRYIQHICYSVFWSGLSPCFLWFGFCPWHPVWKNKVRTMHWRLSIRD